MPLDLYLQELTVELIKELTEQRQYVTEGPSVTSLRSR